MQGRPGPFWDGVEGRAPIPPAAATLGFQLVDADVEAGTIEVAFTATEAFTDPSGNVLGAFLAARRQGPGRPPRRRPGLPGGLPLRRRRGRGRHRHRHRPGDPAEPGTGRA